MVARGLAARSLTKATAEANSFEKHDRRVSDGCAASLANALFCFSLFGRMLTFTSIRGHVAMSD